MGKNKLKKFADLETYRCVLQYPRERLLSEGFPLRGLWHQDHFGNSSPIVLELGCGKGEYTVGLARITPGSNFIGVDIKGARIWKGATAVEKEKIPNAAFLRTEIENIDRFFAPGEVDEIWITFPDPQMQKSRKRLTSTRFISLYRKFLKPEGIIHLKTDSPFLYEYTRRLAEVNGFEILRDYTDLHSSGLDDPATGIRTFYEDQWISRGKSIKLLSIRGGNEILVEPEEDDIERDDYHSVTRHSPTGNGGSLFYTGS